MDLSILLLVHPHLNVVDESEILTRILLRELDSLGINVDVFLTRAKPQSLPRLNMSVTTF